MVITKKGCREGESIVWCKQVGRVTKLLFGAR